MEGNEAKHLLPRVLTFTINYVPGYKGGGPIRTIANLVDRLGTKFQFLVVTRDRELGDHKAYASVKHGDWQPVGTALVRYLAPSDQSVLGLWTVMRSVHYDVLYLNSFFATYYSILPLLLHRFVLRRQTSVIVAPRGELSTAARRIKCRRKRLYMLSVRMLRIYAKVQWQASDQQEATNIRRVFGPNASVVIAPNLPTRFAALRTQNWLQSKPVKAAGAIRLVYVARIARIKNLLVALRALRSVHGRVEFDVYGLIEDRDYWMMCEAEITKLTSRTSVTYRSALPRDILPTALLGNHVLLLPSESENFGHSIVEAFAFGCPVIIGRHTPWQELRSRGIGVNCTTDDATDIAQAVQLFLDMDAGEFRGWQERAAAFGDNLAQAADAIEQNRVLFSQAAQVNAAL